MNPTDIPVQEHMQVSVAGICGVCAGSGYRGEDTCGKCGGTGVAR